MSAPLFALLALAGAALYFMTAAERTQFARSGIAHVREAIAGARSVALTGGAFEEFLASRTSWPIVTPLLLAASVLIWMAMPSSREADAAARTLVAWGANYAPRTTNGEWWRLLASGFVHRGLLPLLATTAGLFPLGLLLERAVGRLTFAAVYFASSIAAASVALWTEPPMSVTCGASGAIFGVYGLAIATAIYGCLRAPRIPVPRSAVTWIAGSAALFALYHLATGQLGTASALAGLLTGLAAGLVVVRGVAERKPPAARSLIVAAAALALTLAAVLPLSRVIDARPELTRIAAIETRTASDYASAVDAFRRGRLPARALVQVIQQTILPRLRADRERVDALRGVPAEQAPLVAAAQRYFELRERSWRRRIDGLAGSNMKVLREAEQIEHAALDAFDRMQADLTRPAASRTAL